MTRWKLALIITLVVMAIVIAAVWAGSHSGPLDDATPADDDDTATAINEIDDLDAEFADEPYEPGVL